MKDKEYNKYAKLDLVKCDTPEKLDIIKNLPRISGERKEVEKPKYNPSVWENEDKQIKEMASDMDYACTKRDLFPSDAKEIAKALIILGYQKIDKDKDVVLSKEKYELLVECSSYEGVMKALKNEYIKGRKETAEKILNEQYQECKIAEQDVLRIRGSKDDDYYKGFSLGMTNTKMHIKELAQQCGAEIKE